MSFEEFQNRARLYVIGALERSRDWRNSRRARRAVRTKGAKIFIAECYALHEAFALSLRRKNHPKH